MEISIKDRNGRSLELGDRVRIIKFTDDSGSASDLYGVESHLNAWVDICYMETFEGVITFDTNLMMVVIQGERRNIPLSNDIRYNLWSDMYDHRISNEDKQSIVEEFGLPNDDYESIIDYIVKINK